MMQVDFWGWAKRTKPSEWTRELLEQFSHQQIALLAKLMGIWYTGTKQSIITNLITLGALRETLAPYDWLTSDHDAEVATVQRLAAAYKGEELRRMCKLARCYAGSTKYGMAASLLAWRNTCRQNGQAVEQQIKEEIAKQPARQIILFRAEEIPVYSSLGVYGTTKSLSELPAKSTEPTMAIFDGESTPRQESMF